VVVTVTVAVFWDMTDVSEERFKRLRNYTSSQFAV
jgi:hypothetical protein